MFATTAKGLGFQTTDYNKSELLMDQFDSGKNPLLLLRLHAEDAAPRFCRAILVSPLASTIKFNPSTQDMKLLSVELQQWFIELFTLNNPGASDLRGRKPGMQRYFKDLPLSFLLGNLEIIMLVGREVTLLSPQPELAFRAFIMNLSYELAKLQIDIE